MTDSCQLVPGSTLIQSQTLLTQSRGVTVLSNILQHTYDPTVALVDTPVTEMNAYVHQEKVGDHIIFSCEKRKHKCRPSGELQFVQCNNV